MKKILLSILLFLAALPAHAQFAPAGSIPKNGQVVYANKTNNFTNQQTITNNNTTTGLSVISTNPGTGGGLGGVTDPVYGFSLLNLVNKTSQGPFVGYWAQNNVRWAFGVRSTGQYQWRASTDGSDPILASNLMSIDTSGNVTMTAAILAPSLATSSAATTGTLCWTTGTGNINVDTTTTCLASLEELKDKHGPITGALDTIMKIEPFWFTWKKETPEYAGDKAEQPGMGAHQVESVDPRLAAYGTDGKLKGVRYQEMTAVLIAAMQEQQREIYALAAMAAIAAALFFAIIFIMGGIWSFRR